MNRFNLSEWSVTHREVTLFLILLVSVSGVWSYMRLGRAEDPEFTIKDMIVTANWPGATADEMQRLVADPIEKDIQQVPHVEKVKTYCRPGSVVMQITLLDSTPPSEVKECWYQVRKQVNDMKEGLPQGVAGPYFNDDFGDVDSVLYLLTGDDVTARDLKDKAEVIRQDLLRVPCVNKVMFYGEQAECIFVEFNNDKLSTLGVSPQEIFDSISKQNEMAAAGSMETSNDAIYLRVNGALTGLGALAAVPVQSGGRIFRLSDIASLRRGPEDPPSFVVRHEGKPALALGVVMTKGANILELGDNLDEALSRIREKLPLGFEITKVADQPKVVDASVGEFLRSFLEALVIVLGVSFLSLGWRAGFVVALAVPLVMAMVMTVMQAFGMSLDCISLGALIIALGLLVDDAIISVEMMAVKMEQGFDRVKAAIFAWNATAFPMLTGTLVTAVGFLPVGLARSVSGEYACGIFYVVAIALVGSWFVAVYFTPYLGIKILPDHVESKYDNAYCVYESKVYNDIRSVINWCVRRCKAVVVLTSILFGISLIGYLYVQRQFFPDSSRPEIMVELQLPEGSAINVTSNAMQGLEEFLQNDPEILTRTSYIGSGAPHWYLPMIPELPRASYGACVLYTADADARDRVKARIEQFVANGGLPQARVHVSILSLGPPVGFPVQFRVMGPDPLKVREFAYQVRDIMRANPKTRDVNLDWNEQAKSVRLVVDEDRARILNLTRQDIAKALQMLLSGVTITQIRDGIELVDVVARAVAEERLSPDRLQDLTITTLNGHAVPLSQVAKVQYAYEDPILWRQNRDLMITVRAEVAPGVQAPDVAMEIEPQFEPLQKKLPMGYRIEAGGALEESDKANHSIEVLLPLTVGLMLCFLMLQLQSFSRLILVLATAPLGMIGAVGALLLFNKPFGFVALLGVLSLAGMIMRNSVILVDQISLNLREGMPEWEAIIESTIRRARPVVLTALAAILAMIPLTRNVFWGPMAYSIMGGLLVATVLTLLFTPALYALIFQVRRN
jgi:multidrug efflux pump subunit AcrB